MLKTLRITSLAAVIIAACGVAVMVILGLRGDPVKKSFLQEPSISEKYKGQAGKATSKKDEVNPLVAQAHLIALRLNPPPPPPPPKPKVDPKAPPPPDNKVRQPIPQPPQPVRSPYEVLATVRYESDPAKSLTLLKSGDRIEWFRQGDKAGHLNIDQVCDGSVILSQNGNNKQTLYVPEKTGKSLLKNDPTLIASAQKAAAAVAQPGQPPQAEQAVAYDTGTDYTVQTTEQSSPVHPGRAELSSRIQRIRAVQPEPTPQQQETDVESAISGIQDIINRQDDPSEGNREDEKKIWMELLSTLEAEKESLRAQEAAAENTQPQSQSADAAQQQADSSAGIENAESQGQPSAANEANQPQPEEGQSTASESEEADAPANPPAEAQEIAPDSQAQQDDQAAQPQPQDEGPAPEGGVNEY